MRPQLNAITSAQLIELARIEGRSCADAIKIAVSERLQQLHARGELHATALVDENGGRCGAFMATRLSPALRDLVHRFSHDDQRSLSSSLKILVRDGLRARGYFVAPTN